MMWSVFQVYGFFGENYDDIQCDDVQYYMCDILVMQQSGGDSDQYYYVSDGCQQFIYVYWGKVWFRVVLFNLFLIEGEVNNGDYYFYYVEGKCYVLVKMCGQLWGCQYREE